MSLIYKISPMVVLMALLTLLKVEGAAQEFSKQHKYKKFPVIVGVQFHNFAMPFNDIESHFSHPGWFVGTEHAFNPKGWLVQSVMLGSYLNKNMGDGMFVNTQLGFRPRIINSFYAEIKAGAGYQLVFHPAPAYKFSDGNWKKINGGKSQLTIPVDLGIGYTIKTNRGDLSPTLSYQINPALFYNRTLPLTIYTNFMLGLRINFI